MTTTVKVSNEGPGDIRVSAVVRGNPSVGQTEFVSETRVLNPREALDFTMYKGNYLQVQEH